MMAEKFTEKISLIVDNGFISIGLGIGVEQGLFSVMADLEKQATSSEIADKADCKERPVREWLHLMSAARIIEVDQTGTLFYLPPDHRAGVQSIHSRMASFISPMAHPHRKLMDMMKKDGPPGLDPADCTSFCANWDKARSLDIKEDLPNVIKEIPGLHEKLTSGITVLDIGTSCGHLCHILASKYPNSTIYGTDINEASIVEAQKIATERGLSNVHFQVENAEKQPADWSEKFDCVIMFDVLHDIPHATTAACEVKRILKKGGSFAVLDVYAHSNPAKNIGDPCYMRFLTISMYYCMSISMKFDESEALGPGAGIEKFTSILEKAGFDMNTKGKIKKFGDWNVLLVCFK